MFLSCPAKKGTKEGGIGEALRKCALPYVPPRRLASQHSKMFRFLNAYSSKCETLLIVDTRKSEHFRVSDGEAAGVSKGVVLRAANQKISMIAGGNHTIVYAFA